MTAKRGRRSAADLAVVDLTGARIQAPDGMTAEQLEQWRAIVDSLPADYFRAGDAPLLRAYCVAAAYYTEADADLRARGFILTDAKGRDYMNPAHQLLTSQAMAMGQLALRLRRCPSARYSGKAAGARSQTPNAASRPWDAATGTDGDD